MLKKMIDFLFLLVLICLFLFSERIEREYAREGIFIISSGSLQSIDIESAEVMARQSVIFTVALFVLFVSILIDLFCAKTYLWKAELPVFWGCKYRIQSPRCKLY